MRMLVTSAAAALLVGAAGSARADERIELGGFVGAHIFNDDIELGTFDEPDPDTPQHGVAFGPRFGFHFTPILAAEGELAIIPGKSRDQHADVVVFGWRAHALVHFTGPDVPLRPFALAGVGALTSSSEDSEVIDEDTDALFHGGVGAKLDLGDDWGVRLDGRVYFPPSSASDLVTTDFAVHIGIYRRFSATPAPPAPAPAPAAPCP